MPKCESKAKAKEYTLESILPRMVATDLIDGRQNANENSALEYSLQLKACCAVFRLARVSARPQWTKGTTHKPTVSYA
jgi:hypothetical protein